MASASAKLYLGLVQAVLYTLARYCDLFTRRLAVALSNSSASEITTLMFCTNLSRFTALSLVLSPFMMSSLAFEKLRSAGVVRLPTFGCTINQTIQLQAHPPGVLAHNDSQDMAW